MQVVDIVILAAGQARRFGSDKRCLTLQPLLATITAALADTDYRLLLVVKTSDSDNLPGLLGEFLHHPALQILPNPHAAQGMGNSLALAAQHLQAPCALVFLADMPFVQQETLLKLLEQAGTEQLLAPLYHQQRGHPVCFGRAFYAEMRQLQGDSGARSLLLTHASQLQLVNVDDKGTVMDIDTPQDWLEAHEQRLV